jgi:hypothetical protein
MMRFGLILLALLSAVLGSCSTSTGRSYPLAVRETTRFLESNSPKELFNLKKRQTDEGMEFYFCDGSKWDKAAVVFPTRVTVGLESKKEGKRSDLKLRAYQQGLFLSGRKRDFEEKWRSAILTHLQTIQPDS